MRKKRRKKGPWWRRGRTWISVALSGLLAAAVAGPAVWLLAGLLAGTGSDPPQYVREPALPFTLPTVAGDDFSLVDHQGRHNVLLFFNEGMG